MDMGGLRVCWGDRHGRKGAGELGHEADGALLGFRRQGRPDVQRAGLVGESGSTRGDGQNGRHVDSPPLSTSDTSFSVAKMGHEVYRTPQPIDIEQGQGMGVRSECRQRGIIGPTQRDRCVRTIRAAHDEIGLSPGAMADANNLDALATERMMRVGDADESRERLGYRGSVLRICLRCTIARCRRFTCWPSIPSRK